MSKKLSRKALALGTALAFGLTGLSALPASAVGDGDLATLEPNNGQSMVGALDHYFDLDAYFDDDNAWSTEALLKVENTANASIWFNDDDIDDSQVYVMKAGKLVEATENSNSDVDAYYESGTEDAWVYDDSVLYVQIDNSDDEIEIGTLEESGSVSLALTLWGDRNSDGILGDLEKSSGVATATLKFVDPASLTPKITLDIADVDTTYNQIDADVTFAQDINVSYIHAENWLASLDEGSTSVDSYTADDSDTDLRSTTVYLTDGSSDSDFNGLEFYLGNTWTDTTTVGSLLNDDLFDEGEEDEFAVGDKLSARIAYTDDGGDTYVWKGAKSSTFEIVAGDNSGDVTGFELITESADYSVDLDEARAGVKTITYTFQAIDGADDLEESGIPVQVFIDELDSADLWDNGWDNDAQVSGSARAINYEDDTTSVVQTETNAAGQVAVTVTVKDASAGVYFDLETLYLDGNASAWSSGTADEPDFEDAVATDFTADSTVIAGANPSVSFDVVDQFGEAISLDDSKALKVELRDSSDTDLLKSSATVVNGSAKITFKNYVETGEYATLEAVLYTGATANAATEILSSITVDLYNPAAAGSVTLDESDLDGNITYDAFVTGDSADLADGVYAPNDTHTTLSGVVKDVNGVDLPAAVVTIAGKGLQFVETGETVYAKDSITVVADVDGEFSVKIWAHEVNAEGIAIKVTSGGKSADATLTTSWLNDGAINNWVINSADDSATTVAAEAAANVVVSWDAPKHPAVNKTYIVTTVVKDTWGNVIDDAVLDYTASGALQINGKDILTDRPTNASGKSTTYVRSVEDVDGYAELTVDVTDVDFGDIEVTDADSITLDLVVGKDGAASAGKNAGVLKVSSWNAKGKTVKVYVAGKLVATRVAPTSTYKFKVTGVKSGSKQVKVVVAGSSFFNAPVAIK